MTKQEYRDLLTRNPIQKLIVAKDDCLNDNLIIKIKGAILADGSRLRFEKRSSLDDGDEVPVILE